MAEDRPMHQAIHAPNTIAAELPSWEECDVFCILDYAAKGAACGWRGRFRDAYLDSTRSVLLCPRCDSATLLRIHPSSSMAASMGNY